MPIYGFAPFYQMHIHLRSKNISPPKTKWLHSSKQISQACEKIVIGTLSTNFECIDLVGKTPHTIV